MRDVYFILGYSVVFIGGITIGVMATLIYVDKFVESKYLNSINEIKAYLRSLKNKFAIKDVEKTYNGKRRKRKSVIKNALNDVNSDLRKILNKLSEKTISHRQNQVFAEQKTLPRDGGDVTTEIIPNEVNKGDDNFLANQFSTFTDGSNQNSGLFGAKSHYVDYESHTNDKRNNFDADEEKPYGRFAVPENKTPTQEFLEIYNHALENRAFRSRFREKYQIYRFGNRNASAQAQGMATDAEFRTSDSGDFIAICPIVGGSFLAVPQFDISISETTFNEGGLGTVFDCEGYQQGKSYSVLRVVKPAIFEMKNDLWQFRKKGELNLIS